MEIVKYTNENIDEVSRVYALSWQTAYRGIVPDDYLDALSETRWSPHLARDSGRLLLAKEDETVVGASTYCPARDPLKAGWGEIISLYLLPSYYRKGIGTKLLKAAVNELKAAGFRQMYLWVLEENRSARKFYEAGGFTDSGDFQNDVVGGRAVRELRYVIDVE